MQARSKCVQASYVPRWFLPNRFRSPLAFSSQLLVRFVCSIRFFRPPSDCPYSLAGTCQGSGGSNECSSRPEPPWRARGRRTTLGRHRRHRARPLAVCWQRTKMKKKNRSSESPKYKPARGVQLKATPLSFARGSEESRVVRALRPWRMRTLRRRCVS